MKLDGKSIRKDQTKQALLDALAIELVQPARLTVERVASRAGVNKSLVYRYFGGLPGLVTAYAESDDFMPRAEELQSLINRDLHVLLARQRFVECVKAYIHALARRPSSVQILLRLHLLDIDVVSALQSGRAQAIAEIVALFGETDDNFPIDPELCFGILISGICQVLGHRRKGWLKTETTIDELSVAMAKSVEVMLLG